VDKTRGVRHRQIIHRAKKGAHMYSVLNFVRTNACCLQHSETKSWGPECQELLHNVNLPVLTPYRTQQWHWTRTDFEKTVYCSFSTKNKTE
jgi:hypothetical protein